MSRIPTEIVEQLPRLPSAGPAGRAPALQSLGTQPA